MKDAIIIIDVFLNSQSKINIFENLLKTIKKLNIPILVISNFEAPQRILNEIDYFIFSKENLLFSENSFDNYPGAHFYMEIDGMRYENHTYCSQKHGLSVLCNLTKTYRFAQEIGFKKAIKIEWDFNISETDIINLKSTIDDFIINDKRAFFTLNPSNAFGLPDLEGHFWMVDLKFWNNNFPKIHNASDYGDFLLQVNGNNKFFEIVERVIYLSVGAKLNDNETITNKYFHDSIFSSSTINTIISDNNFSLPSSDGVCRGLTRIKRNGELTGELVLFTWNRSSDLIDNKSYIVKFNNKIINYNHSVEPKCWAYSNIPFDTHQFPLSLEIENFFYKEYNSLYELSCDLIFY
jgi:hypothetical protein